MVLDTIIVAVVVAGAVAYLAWSLVPKRKRTLPACSGCAQSEAPKPAPVRTRWTG